MFVLEFDLLSVECVEYENVMNQLLDDYENGNISDVEIREVLNVVFV